MCVCLRKRDSLWVWVGGPFSTTLLFPAHDPSCFCNMDMMVHVRKPSHLGSFAKTLTLAGFFAQLG